jgi:hypothetical protein
MQIIVFEALIGAGKFHVALGNPVENPMEVLGQMKPLHCYLSFLLALVIIVVLIAPRLRNAWTEPLQNFRRFAWQLVHQTRRNAASHWTQQLALHSRSG